LLMPWYSRRRILIYRDMLSPFAFDMFIFCHALTVLTCVGWPISARSRLIIRIRISRYSCQTPSDTSLQSHQSWIPLQPSSKSSN
jgi:hypothetical protein